MYQISRVQTRPGSPGFVTTESEHFVEKLLGWYPAGPLKDDDPVTGTREQAARERKHDLVKFIARDGGTRVVRARDLTLL